MAVVQYDYSVVTSCNYFTKKLVSIIVDFLEPWILRTKIMCLFYSLLQSNAQLCSFSKPHRNTANTPASTALMLSLYKCGRELNESHPVSSGVSVGCDGSVAGPVHPGFPAALPLSQPAHQRAVSSPREGAAAGLQSVWQRLAHTSTSSSNTHHLCLTESVWGSDGR